QNSPFADVLTSYKDGQVIQSGASVKTANVTDEEQFVIGNNGPLSAGYLPADVYYAKVADGIGGPLIVDMSAAASGLAAGPVPDSTTWVGKDGRTYTAHGGIEYTAPLAANTPDLYIWRYGKQTRYVRRCLLLAGTAQTSHQNPHANISQ
ncbi:unnamed protein product, partial [marine sediment metagenome]